MFLKQLLENNYCVNKQYDILFPRCFYIEKKTN